VAVQAACQHLLVGVAPPGQLLLLWQAQQVRQWQLACKGR
jgi:hypothetical protein